MAAVRGGVCSGGSTNTRHAAHLFPLPCIGEPAATSCFSPGSSVARSKALRAAACYTSDAKPVPEVEASAGKNRNMPIAISATRGRGERYGSRQASSYGAVPLTHRRHASSSLGTRGSGGYHEPHGGDDAFSSITRRLENLQGRLPTRAHFTKPSPSDCRQPGIPLFWKGEESDWRFTKARGKENEVYDQNNWQTDNVSSRISSARDWNFDFDGAFEGSKCSPIFMKPSGTPQNIRVQTHRSLLDRRGRSFFLSIHKAAPARLIHQSPSHNRRQHVDAIDANNDCIVPKVSEGKDEVNEQDWQMDTMSSHVSSARDWNFEFDIAFEGRNHSGHLVKPSAMPRNIRVQIPRHPSLLDRRVDRIILPFTCQACSSDNLPSTSNVFLVFIISVQILEGLCPYYPFNAAFFDLGTYLPVLTLESSSTASNSSKSAPGPLGKVKGKVGIVRSASAHTSGGTVGAKKKEAYITTLGAGGGYGDPHPPPFYKCEVRRKGTTFYRLKCCRLVVCECCGCACEPAEDEEDEKLLQSRRGKVQAGKEKLPKVKLVGSDLFLWQPCSFPAGLMLCMAKRTGNHLQYYFAPVDELMNPKVRVVRATVYNFRQHGRNARSLSVRDELLTRKQLR
ncbi:hypothetical protein GQ55_1G301900 [Panicum hallii var. hallii]|uniref:Uncharacterized protein n=1 Tax=Panicum hallii var. hallii TaxID=1504633 RepID=A0A2T7F927_9POAL|nr:hypothetical protein GQ55_1G301900 [Panicum hallii var. hallii]